MSLPFIPPGPAGCCSPCPTGDVTAVISGVNFCSCISLFVGSTQLSGSINGTYILTVASGYISPTGPITEQDYTDPACVIPSTSSSVSANVEYSCAGGIATVTIQASPLWIFFQGSGPIGSPIINSLVSANCGTSTPKVAAFGGSITIL